MAKTLHAATELRVRDARELGRRVRAARTGRGLSTQKAAALLGVSTRFLNELERGKPTIQLQKALHVSSALGVTLTAGAASAAPDWMEHRHLNHRMLTAAALDDIVQRGGLSDWLRLAAVVRASPRREIARKLERACQAFAEDTQAQTFWKRYLSWARARN